MTPKYERGDRRICDAPFCDKRVGGRWRWCAKHLEDNAAVDGVLRELLKIQRRVIVKQPCEVDGCSTLVVRGMCKKHGDQRRMKANREKLTEATRRWRAAKKQHRENTEANVKRRVEKVLNDRMLSRHVYDTIFRLGYEAGHRAATATHAKNEWLAKRTG